MAPQEDHFLSAAKRVWQDVAVEFKVPSHVQEENCGVDGNLISPDELKKVAKWMQHTVTKLGASASVADGADRSRALQPIAEEVIKAFTASVGTILSMRTGAGPTLLVEMLQVGSELASAADALGVVVAVEGSESLGINVGKILERVKYMERLSVSNRAAVRRRILKGLTQLRDIRRELEEILKDAEKEEGDDDDDFDDFDDFDDSLEPEEKRVIESLSLFTQALEDVLKEASQSCVATKSPSSETASLMQLERALVAATTCVDGVDSMTACSRGGLEIEPFRAELSKVINAVSSFDGVASSAVAALRSALTGLEAAAEAAATET